MVSKTELADGVWRISLDSPQDRNALSSTVRHGILDALDDARVNGAKVAIVAGDEASFSSGYRLDPGVMRPTTLVEDRARLAAVGDFMNAYRQQPVVTIAEVRGYCVAGGTDLLLASDIALAASDASIGVPNVRGIGITLMLPLWSWLIGPQKAKLLALTGDMMTGVEAAHFGIVADAVDGEDLAARTEGLAARIALMPTELLQVTKEALNVAWDTAGLRTTLLRAAELDAISHATDPVIGFWDTVESDGVRAAVAARDARFKGGRMLDFVTGHRTS